MKWLLKKLLASVIREVVNESSTDAAEYLSCEHASKCSQRKQSDELLFYYETTVGLWCIDRDPREVDIDWIRENAFRLKSIHNDPL